jgi:hypothetical protein
MTPPGAGKRAVQPGDLQIASPGRGPDTSPASRKHRTRPHRGDYHRFIEANAIAR